MSKIPYMPLYVCDYEADAGHLTFFEDGVYNSLLRLCWKSPACMIPDDEDWIFRRLRASAEDERATIRAILAEFFQRKGGKLFQKRQIEEYNRVSEIYDARSEAGKKGGHAKALKEKELRSGKANAKPKQSHGDDMAGKGCNATVAIGVHNSSLGCGEQQAHGFLNADGAAGACSALDFFEGGCRALKNNENSSGVARVLPEQSHGDDIARPGQNHDNDMATRTRTRTKEEEKEEEGAQAREPENSNFAESEPAIPQASPPDRRPELPNLSPGFLDDLRQAVGVPTAAPPPYWSSPGLDAHAARWIEVHGLTEDQIIAAARASRGRNPEPPDGPKALDAWIATTAKGLQGAAEVKPGKAPAPPKATTTPTTPEERMKFYAEWINSDKVCPPSVISTHMAAMLIEAKLVTKERLRERGIAA